MIRFSSPGSGPGGGASEATTSALGTVKVASPPRSGLNATVEIPRLSADRWVKGRSITTLFTGDPTKSVSGVAATGVFTTSAAHGYSVGDLVIFALTTGGSGLTAGLPYYVVTVPSTTTFTVALTVGGTTVTFSSDLTSGTVRRMPDGYRFDFTNMLYTTSSGRQAVRAADGGTGTIASLLTKEKNFQNWEIRVRYRPANDAATASTDYGVGLYGSYQDPANTWYLRELHASGNPNAVLASTIAGTDNPLNGAVTAASPLSTTQDRVVKLRKEGDRLMWKDWATNTVEPDWQAQGRIQSTVDNSEWGALGIVNLGFNGAYFLEFAAHELKRRSGNLLWNADFTRLDCSTSSLGQVATADQVRAITGGVAATGVFTTSAAHGYSVGDRVVFCGFNGGAGASQPADVGIWAGHSYYVAAVPISTTFTVAAARGGAAITFANNMGAATVVRNPPPAWWQRPRQALLLSGNYNEIVHTDGPDGSIRPVLSLVIATPNDPNLKWIQDIYDVSKVSGESGGFGGRVYQYPQFETARRYEMSFWARGSFANIAASSLGLTFDAYMYDHNGSVLFMDRAAYHPGVSPTTAADPTLGAVNAPDVASYDGYQSNSTFGWTFLRGVIEQKMWESVMYMQVALLPHDATMTGWAQVCDPCLRPIG